MRKHSAARHNCRARFWRELAVFYIVGLVVAVIVFRAVTNAMGA